MSYTQNQAPEILADVPPHSYNYQAHYQESSQMHSEQQRRYANHDYHNDTIQKSWSFAPSMVTQKANRMQFIKKVYAILSLQLIWTVLVVGIVIAVESLRQGIAQTWPIVLVLLVISIVVLLMVFCWRKCAWKFPQNMIALGVFTVCQSYILAFICAFYEPLIVLVAAVMALAITTGLTIYAWTTKRDFTTCAGMITVIIISVIFFLFFLIFFFSQIVYMIFCFVMILVYGFFIVYDTQLIAGGRYQELTYDDYVVGSLLLYIDIIGLFLYILSLLGKANKGQQDQ